MRWNLPEHLQQKGRLCRLVPRPSHRIEVSIFFSIIPIYNHNIIPYITPCKMRRRSSSIELLSEDDGLVVDFAKKASGKVLQQPPALGLPHQHPVVQDQGLYAINASCEVGYIAITGCIHIYRSNIGIMENKMETTILYWGYM